MGKTQRTCAYVIWRDEAPFNCFPAGQHYRDRIGHWLCNLDYVDIRDVEGLLPEALVAGIADALEGKHPAVPVDVVHRALREIHERADAVRRQRFQAMAADLGNMIITSGQIPVNPKTGEVPADVAAQARQSLDNVKAIVEAAGLKVGDIVKTTVFVKDLNDFATVNATYEAFFTEHNATFPARSCVEVARLPKDVKIEIEAIAVRR